MADYAADSKEKGVAVGRRDKFPVVCFILSLLCICGALAGVWRDWPVDELIIIRDVSASMLGQTDTQKMDGYVQRLTPHRIVEIVAAGEAAVRSDTATENTFTVLPDHLMPDQTNLEKALRLAAEIESQGIHRRRVLLLTDGRENRGDAADFLAKGASKMLVDLLPGGNAPLPDGKVLSINTPEMIVARRESILQAVCTVSPAQQASVRLFVDGKLVSEKRLQIFQRPTPVEFTLQLERPGVQRIEAQIEVQGDVVVQNNRCTTQVEVRRPGKILWAADSKFAYSFTDMPVEQSLHGELPELNPYSLVVLSGSRLEAFAKDPQRLRAYLQDGGRVVLVYDRKFLEQALGSDALREILPTDPSDSSRSATVFLLDVSGSMGEKPTGGRWTKLELSVRALQYALAGLDGSQRAAVLAFNMQPQVVVPLRRPPFERYEAKLQTLAASGGTEIFSALKSGIDILRDTQALRRQIVLLTDGDDKEKDDQQERVRQVRTLLQQHGIRLDVVAIGKDANHNLLDKFVEGIGGVSEASESLTALPAILQQKVEGWSEGGLTVKDLQTIALAEGRDNLLAPGSRVAQAYRVGPLKTGGGYEALLAAEGGDVLLAKGAFGLGNVITLSGDPESMWGLGRQAGMLWQKLLRQNVLPDSLGDLQITPYNGFMEVVWKPHQIVSAGWKVKLEKLGSHDLVSQPVPLRPGVGGLWSAIIPQPAAGGYIVKVYSEQQTGVQRVPVNVDERNEYLYMGADGTALQRLAHAGGGRVLYRPQQIDGWDDVPLSGEGSRLPRILLYAGLFFLLSGIVLKGLLP